MRFRPRSNVPPNPVDLRQLRAAVEAADEVGWAGLGFRRRKTGIYERPVDDDFLLAVVDMLTDEDPPDRSDISFGLHWTSLERELASSLGQTYNPRSSSVMTGLVQLAPRSVTLPLELLPRAPEAATVRAAAERAHAVFAVGRPWFEATANPAGLHRALHAAARPAAESWLEDVARLALSCQLNGHRESAADLARILDRRADEWDESSEHLSALAKRLSETG